MTAYLSAVATASTLIVLCAPPLGADRGQQSGGAAQKSTVSATLELQVRLDRAGFSPGEIDGVAGSNTARAVAAIKKAGRTVGTDPIDVVVNYTVTPDDVAGPFTEAIPTDLMEQSKLPALNYTSVLEALGERFHSSPALLQKLNPGAQFAAGETILVPNITNREPDVTWVTPAPGAKPPTPPPPQRPVTVVVSKSASLLTVLDEKGGVLFAAPVTSGSAHDPLPLGKWAVTTVSRRPPFHYNPDLFWDANPTHAKARIPPGPNNPVGVVWIDLTREHYGIHGSPNPGKIGHTESHGCVRLTNWDASYVASLVAKGTPVRFER